MTTLKNISKKYFVALLVLILTAVVATAYFGYPTNSSSFSYQKLRYECSQNIKGRSGLRGFKPSNQVEFEKYCREYYDFGGFGPPDCHNCEYRAVLDILRRSDVSKTIEKYDTTLAWVRALHHNYIHDKEYLKRILPAYSHMKIDCIIVVHSPEGTRFFIENGETHKSHDDHQYLEISSNEFLTSLNKASDSDISSFWLSLR